VVGCRRGQDVFGFELHKLMEAIGGVVADLKRDKKQDMDILEEYVSKCVLCWLATVDTSGAPNVSPKEVFDLVDGRLVIANIASPRSSANIRANSSVCVSLLDIFEQKGVRVSGRATIMSTTSVEAAELWGKLESKTGGRFPFKEIFVVEVDEVQPYTAPSWYLFPEMSPEDRRSGTLRSYGVRDSEV
jgi:predicted pyridoxine 5'-phosphate oxidase superfamily flavin-nucleotide-binding protein